jgi:hypothetical protein
LTDKNTGQNTSMNSLTRNILTVFDYLAEHNLADTREFSKKVGIYHSVFLRIRAGELDFPDDKVYKVMRAYHVNSYYLFHGTGKMFWVTYHSGIALKEQKKLVEIRSFTSLENIKGDIQLSLN